MNHPGRVHAYSLLEMLVATAVLALMVALLANVVSGVSSAWSNSIGRSERSASARAIADFIRSDLTTALIPIDEASQTNLQFVLNPASLSREYKNGDALFWQAPIATNRELGEIAEVGYYVRWASRKDTPVPILCRFFVNPATKDSSGAAVANPNFLIHTEPTNWINNDLIEAIAPGISTMGATVRYDGLFAENVVAIWFRCLDSQGKAFSRDFDSRIGQEDSFPDPDTGKKLWRRLPCSVQVSFALLDPRAGQRLNQALQTPLCMLAEQTAATIEAGGLDDHTVSPAREFVERAGGDPELHLIVPHLRPFTTTVHLSNSK